DNVNGRKIPIMETFNLLIASTKGHTPDEMLGLARDYVKNGSDVDGRKVSETFLKDERGETMRDLFDVLRGKGVDLYFNSANLTFIAQAVAEQLGADVSHVLGSEVQVGDDGRFTGELAPADKGAEHTQMKFDRFVRTLGVPPAMFFGDSP